MPSERNLLSRPICRDETIALVVLMFCLSCGVALIPVSYWGMTRLEFTTTELFLGSLLTLAPSILLILAGAVTYLFVKRRPEPVKVLASRAPSQE
ncbi:MAG TPA: hypothetical protein VLA12_21175 [Planctomycetaceae bacterium]|nr:hypothetical protein [Planctomycetaceae bacterium]